MLKVVRSRLPKRLLRRAGTDSPNMAYRRDPQANGTSTAVQDGRGVSQYVSDATRILTSICSAPDALLPASWTSISSVEEMPSLAEVDIQPDATVPTDGRPRRARSAGSLSSLLRVKSSDGEEVLVGMALLRLEMADGELGLRIPDTTSGADVEAGSGTAGVNAAGGLQASNKSPLQSLAGQWKAKAFRGSLKDAR